MADKNPLGYEVLSLEAYATERDQILTHLNERAGQPGSHIALIGDPYAGRDIILRDIYREFHDSAAYIPLEKPIQEFKQLFETYKDYHIVIIDNCQYLATRRIGGFTALEEFLQTAATVKTTLLTSWNLFAWNYLTQVVSLDSYFALHIKMSPLTGEQLKNLILTRYSREIQCINDASIKKSIIKSSSLVTIPVPFSDRTITLPWISIDLNLLRSALFTREKETPPDKVVFDRLAAVSRGNSGVATDIWNSALVYPEIRISRIPSEVGVPPLTPDEAWVLVNCFMQEEVSQETLGRVFRGGDIGRLLFLLQQKGILEKHKERMRIRPTMLNPVREYLEDRRMVW